MQIVANFCDIQCCIIISTKGIGCVNCFTDWVEYSTIPHLLAECQVTLIFEKLMSLASKVLLLFVAG